MKQPYIGAIVHFVGREAAYPSSEAPLILVHRPAIVTRIHRDEAERVYLIVFGAHALALQPTIVCWDAIAFSELKEYGTWHWPEEASP